MIPRKIKELDNALKNLEAVVKIDVKRKSNSLTQENQSVLLKIHNVEFLCIISETTDPDEMMTMAKAMRSVKPILFFVYYFDSTLSQSYREREMNVIDSVGNYCFNYVKDNTIIKLFHADSKPLGKSYNNYPLFRITGVKVLFYLLYDINNVAQSYRRIAEETGVSLGTVKNVLTELDAKKFILTTKNGRFLRKKKELLELWIMNYNQVLKPSLQLISMSFRKDEYREKWNTIKIPTGMLWGGECAANLIDGYLYPGSFEIYTSIDVKTFMKSGYAFPKDGGEITFFQKFWEWGDNQTTVPTILIYADLMGSDDSRCIEAAKRIFDNELTIYK